jgi:hypothetical protein
MTHGLSAEVQKAGGKRLARQSAEEWYAEIKKGTIRPNDVRWILWDWELERKELLAKIADLEKENDQLVELGELIKEKHDRLRQGIYEIIVPQGKKHG